MWEWKLSLKYHFVERQKTFHIYWIWQTCIWRTRSNRFSARIPTPPPPEYLTCQSAGLHKYGYVSCFRVPALCTHGATIPALPITYSSSPAGCTVHLFTSGIGTRLHSHYCGELPTYNARPRIMPLPPREPNLTRSDGRMEIQYFQGTLSWILISVCVWYNRWSSRAKLEPAGCYLAGR
jgi:hypothetical protein